MSEPGDCVWADGRAWMQTDWDEKSRWITESIARLENRTTLKALKQHDDFRWLVKDGKRDGSDLADYYVQVGFEIGKFAGFALERKAVLTFLRDPNWADMSALYVADHIERGEHLRGDDE